MRGQVKDLLFLIDDSQSMTLFLEKDTINLFLDWIRIYPEFAQYFAERLSIKVFKNHVSADMSVKLNILRKLHINILGYTIKPSDNLFIDEVERTYFSTSGANHRQLAEFYLMVRRSAGNGWVNIISQDRSFERIPMVNTYFIGTAARTGSQDLPAQFDFIQDFNIHPNLARMISARIDDPNRGGTLFDSITVLRDHVRAMSGLATDGYQLMHPAFDDNNPIIKVNPRTDLNPQGTQRNEQQGYHDFYCGVMKGMRNPLAHEGTASPFATSRYSDKAKMLKYLSFLSVLCERADGPLP